MIVVQAPLRISFLGGGTDFDDFYRTQGGAVLSTAINKCVYVIVKERFDNLIYVNYSQKEIVEHVDQLCHELVREAMKKTGVENAIEITTLADVPSEGSGLGSSSAITVALLQSLYIYQGQTVTARELAEQACQIEIDILGKPVGRQDQYISAFGNMQYITFDNQGIDVERIDIPVEAKRKLNRSLLLFYTGKTRKADEILSEQKSNIQQNTAVLLEMKKLAWEAKKAVLEENFDEIGRLMHRSWQLKKEFASKVTNSDIDEVYQTALDAGAIGGKISGAGGGGFLLLYCSSEQQDEGRAALNRLRELPFRFQSDGSKVIFNYRPD